MDSWLDTVYQRWIATVEQMVTLMCVWEVGGVTKCFSLEGVVHFSNAGQQKMYCESIMRYDDLHVNVEFTKQQKRLT